MSVIFNVTVEAGAKNAKVKITDPIGSEDVRGVSEYDIDAGKSKQITVKSSEVNKDQGDILFEAKERACGSYTALDDLRHPIKNTDYNLKQSDLT